MKKKNAKVGAVKSFNINIRVSDDLRHKVDYIKLLPGGITGWIEQRLRELEVDEELLDKLKRLQGPTG